MSTNTGLCPKCGARLEKRHGSICKLCATDRCKYTPTPAQIRQACLQIRAQKTPEQLQRMLRVDFRAQPMEFPCASWADRGRVEFVERLP
jgi:NMD protein affecting ribosome stability and mRNA decay